MSRLLPLCMLSLALLPLSTTIACGDKDGGGDDGATDDGGTDSGGDDGGVTWDEGCITSDDASQDSFASIADAVEASAEGATISLAGCEDPWGEPVSLSKGVTLDFGGLTLDNGESPAISITGSGAAVTDVVVVADGDAVVVDGATGVTVADLSTTDPGGYGVAVINDGEATVERLTVSGGGGGALADAGGTLALLAASITDVQGYGAVAQEATLTLTSSAVTGITASGGPGSSDGGLGLVSISGDIEATDTTVSASVYGIYAETGSLLLDGVDVTGGQFGVLASESDLVAAGLTVTDATTCGVYAFSEGSIDISDMTVVGTDGVVDEIGAEAWYDAAYVSTGAFLYAPSVTVTDSSVDGYGGAGMLVASDAGEATLARLTLTNQGNHGLYVSASTTTAEDVVIQDTRAVSEVTDSLELCYAVDSDVAATIVSADVTWTGGEISGSEGYGISSLSSDLTLDGVTVSGNRCAGLMNFQSGATVRDSTFTDSYGGAFGGSIVHYEGTDLSVTGSTFADSQTERLYDTEEYGRVRYDYYTAYGTDVQVFYSGDVTASGNTHETGTNAFELYADTSGTPPSLAVSDSTFTDYKGFVAYLDGGSTGTLSGVEVDGYDGYVLYCEGGGTVDLTDVKLSNGGSLSTRYEVYTDGELTDSEVFTEYGEAIFVYGCDVDAENLELDTAQGPGVLLADTSADVDDLDITGVGTAEGGDALSIFAQSGATTAFLDGGSLDAAGGSGLAATVYSSATANVSLFNVSTSNSGGDGLSLGNTGYNPSNASFSMTNSSVNGAGGAGVYADDVALTVSGGSFADNETDGLWISGGTLSISEVTAVANGSYGMRCENDPVISTCDVTAVENGEGDFLDCGEICGGSGDGGGDTGSGDTGSGETGTDTAD